MFKECGGDNALLAAIKIHAICADEKVDIDKTRLLTYMYFKINEPGNDINYFERESEQDCIAIEAMLGNMIPLWKLLSDSTVDKIITDSIEEHCTSIANTIRRLDYSLHETVGMENRLSGELRNRLRLYRDEMFRCEMIRLYKQLIVPRLEQVD